MGTDIDPKSEEQDEPHGANPTEEVGPEDAEAGPHEVEYRLADDRAENPPTNDMTLRDEVAEAFPVTAINVAIDPADGLPTPMDGLQLATSVPFDAKHLVCLEDDSEFVEMFEEEAERVEWMSRLQELIGKKRIPAPRSAYDKYGEPHERRVFSPEVVVKRWGYHVVLIDDEWVLVRPKRERCMYYLRQVAPNDEQPDPTLPGHKIVFRRCTQLRSNGGAFLSLRDEGIYACDHRFPEDPETVRVHLDEPDKKRANTPPEMVPLFNMTANDGDRG